MKKSVYSLVLIDDLVEQLDHAAYARGLSRSGMINEILADYLSVVTPERQIQQTLDTARDLLDSVDALQLVAPPGREALLFRAGAILEAAGGWLPEEVGNE